MGSYLEISGTFYIFWTCQNVKLFFLIFYCKRSFSLWFQFLGKQRFLCANWFVIIMVNFFLILLVCSNVKSFSLFSSCKPRAALQFWFLRRWRFYFTTAYFLGQIIVFGRGISHLEFDIVTNLFFILLAFSDLSALQGKSEL